MKPQTTAHKLTSSQAHKPNSLANSIKIILLILIIPLLSLVSAGCCEKLSDGGWCQESTQSSCAEGFQYAPTSCDQTSYCQSGTCLDTEEGMCTPNTPRKSCEESDGFWTLEDRTDLPQCQYGCCFLGDDSVFVTQAKCSRLASENNIQSNYRADITDEMSCMALSGGAAEGACVLVGDDLTRNCRISTKSECSNLQESSAYEEVIFHEGYLCTAEFLGTICDPRGGTICPDNKIGVYFKDTCGNIANVYDADKIDEDHDYWTYLYGVEDSCKYGDLDGNANDRGCGNCDYQYGSKCVPYDKDETAKPAYGDNICKDLGCTYNNEDYDHGEKWCQATNAKGIDGFLPGTESYILKCYDGIVEKEGCSVGNWRAQICIDDEDEDGKKVASCKSNLWHDCLEQETEKDCTNSEERDCKWVEGKSILAAFGLGKAVDENEKSVDASCLPIYPRALNNQDDSIDFLDFGYEQVLIPYRFNLVRISNTINEMDGNTEEDREERFDFCGRKDTDGLFGGTFSKVNHTIPECEASDASPNNNEWLSVRNEICSSLGDTHLTTNYLGYEGLETETMFYKFVRSAKDVEEELAELD